jgi:signal transduction protein with GAF and PtsI domain
VQSKKYLEIIATVADAYNSPVGTKELLERTARALVEQLELAGCEFRLLSQDQELLEHIASSGLSERFLTKGPVEAERLSEALAGADVVIDDCASDSRVQYPEVHAEEGLASALVVPLKTRGQVIGVMQAYAGRKREYSETDLKLMEVVAAFSARAITNAMFHQILDGVTAAVRSSLSVRAALDSVVKAISEDLRLKGCSIHLLDSKDKELQLRADFGLSKRFLAFLKTDPSKGLSDALQGQCTQLLDPREEPRTPFLERVMEEGISSILYVYTHHPYPFSEDERYFMKAIADECGLAIQQSQMYTMLRQSYETMVNDFQIWFESGFRQL